MLAFWASWIVNADIDQVLSINLKGLLGGRLFDGGTNGDVASRWSGDGAGDEDDSVLGTDLNDFEILGGAAADTVMTWHLLVFPNAGRCRSSTNGTSSAVHHVTVTVRLTIVVVALHVSLKALTFGGSDDVDPLPCFKEACARVTVFLVGDLVITFEAKLLDELLGNSGSVLGLVSALRKIEASLLLIVISDLDGGVTVLLRGLHLKKFVPAHVDDSDGDHAACFYVKDASHTDFFTEDSE